MAISTVAAPKERSDWPLEWAGPVAVLTIVFMAIVSIVVLGPAIAASFYGEEGPVEVITLVSMLAIVPLYAALMPRLHLTTVVPALIALLMGWRELDGDRWFTNKSVLSTGYYFDNSGVPYGERILVGVIMSLIGLAILRFFWRARFSILGALREFQPYCRSVIAGFAMLGLSLALDGLGRKLAVFGVHVSEVGSAMGKAIEEAAELGLAVAFLIALLQLRFDPTRNVLPDR
jgi:hypothetical protein